MEMDLSLVRYPDFKNCAFTATGSPGVVGEVAALIFGSDTEALDRATLKYANRLGLAFQLTNIIRDVGEDARRNRIYLPQDELARFGVTEADSCRPE
jgi:phytoene synthase